MNERLYMCKTDYEFELGNAAGGIRVYSSMADLKNCRGCIDECGAVEVEVIFKGDVKMVVGEVSA